MNEPLTEQQIQEHRPEDYELTAAVAKLRWRDVQRFEASAYVAIGVSGEIVGHDNSVPELVRRVRKEKGQDFVFTTANVGQFRECE